ncbi:MAG: hypothetical protein Q9N34_06410 [Aquificota bacterium]|nr:hypothetical protein [Aquificota bacterium]
MKGLSGRIYRSLRDLPFEVVCHGTPIIPIIVETRESHQDF